MQKKHKIRPKKCHIYVTGLLCETCCNQQKNKEIDLQNKIRIKQATH